MAASEFLKMIKEIYAKHYMLHILHDILWKGLAGGVEIVVANFVLMTRLLIKSRNLEVDGYPSEENIFFVLFCERPKKIYFDSPSY